MIKNKLAFYSYLARTLPPLVTRAHAVLAVPGTGGVALAGPALGPVVPARALLTRPPLPARATLALARVGIACVWKRLEVILQCELFHVIPRFRDLI